MLLLPYVFLRDEAQFLFLIPSTRPAAVSIQFAVVAPPKLCLGMELARCDLTACLKTGLVVPDCEPHEIGMSWHGTAKGPGLAKMILAVAEALRLVASSGPMRH